jgi:hypothetical protein
VNWSGAQVLRESLDGTDPLTRSRENNS